MNIFNYTTPIGKLAITDNGKAVVGVGFDKKFPFMVLGCPDRGGVCEKAYEQLMEYFAGTRKEFDLPLVPAGTPFQKRVWDALLKIPYGKTVSYSDIALAIGNPKAVRAVGMACNRNPIAIIVPCHRVVGKSGKLVGYAGGLEIKQRLLELERN